MMQSGASRELFESWCSDRKNGVIIAGYSVEGTLAKQITTQATDKIKTMGGQTVPVRTAPVSTPCHLVPVWKIRSTFYVRV